MANPGGGNQFGNYTLQPRYGDMRRRTQLTREAPISGAPFSQQFVNAPRRAQKAAGAPRSQKAAQTPPPVQVPTPQQQGPAPTVMRSIAQIPGASPLVQSLFGNA